jgi:CRP-like cAMP-binding protein
MAMSKCMAAKIEQKKREILEKFAEDLNVSDLAAFAKCFSYVKLPKGASVFDAGAVADRLYVVAQGQVWVQLQGKVFIHNK